MLKPIYTLAALCLFLLCLAQPASALNILVTNDDSCNSEGVNTLADVLEAAGHSVTVVSPAGQQSGKSSSISTQVFKAYDISNKGFLGPTSAKNRFCVRVPTPSPEEGAGERLLTASASPRDSALVGLQMLRDTPPDLVVSGINDGQNIGAVAVASGTVGAAVAALQQGYPAIAVSRNKIEEEGALSFEELAKTVVSVIAKLEAVRAKGEPVLPERTGLNINSPRGKPRGIAFTQLGNQSDIALGPMAKGDQIIVGFSLLSLADLIGKPAAKALSANPNATLKDFAAAGLDVTDESSASVAGFITISTIDGDYTASPDKQMLVQKWLGEL